MIAFVCPRCQTSVEDQFYGPCPPCRAHLRAAMGTEGHAVERTAFEPAMHVTPNAVALKE